MPVYTYRREDGTTFDVKQKFLDEPLTVDPATGQRVVRVVQAAGIIFKGSGFYVNDSKSASKKNISSPAANGSTSPTASDATSTETKPAPESKPEVKAEPKVAAATPAAAD